MRTHRRRSGLSSRNGARSLPLAFGSAGVALALVAVAPEAQAQSETLSNENGGANAHLFRPPVDSKGFITVNGTDVVGHLDFSLGLFLDYGYGIMPLTEGKHGEDADYLLTHSFQGTLQFNLGVANLLTFGIAVPVVLAGIQPNIENVGPTGGLYDVEEHFAQGLEFIALNAKIRIIRPYDKPSIGLAGILQGGVGVAGSDDFIAEPGGFIWPQLAFEGRAAPGGIFRVGVNAGFRANFGGTNAVMGADADGDPILDSGLFEYGQQVTSSLGLSIRVVDPLDLIAETYASFLVTGENDTAQRISAEAIGGLKVFIDGKSFLYLAGGAGYAPGFEAATARGTLGFVFEPSIGDRDRDGFKDDEDDCPDQPEDKDGFEDTFEDSPQGQVGCPDPDNDKDGILDVDDQCPNNPEDKDGDEDLDGCPESRDGDRDGDGILDSRDKCPDEPEDKDGFEDRDGCPDPDNDKDGIPDVKDACPDDPEDKDGVEDEDGCPEPDPSGPVIISGNDILILEKVQFATGSARILPESNKILDAVANTLKEHPEFLLVEIQGHADERSDDKYNLKLTKDRAKSVNDALIQRGVDKSRVRSMGFGEYCPLDEGHDETAWEKNRRVEFKIVRTKDGPTGVELGCEVAKGKGVQSPPP
ncbi:MAG: OmpA family protein [Polyangiaceae bacterium]|nr:OmpA family protein [Polyangiaceae bacterium]